MGLDITVNCPCCGAQLVDEQITYNMAQAYFRVLRASGLGRNGFRGLHGQRLGDIAPRLRCALEFTERHHDRLRQYEPANGWGGVRCILRVLRALLAAAERAPDGVVEVW